eukprot:TRINITY_DN19817_c1_g1_i1.p1 TRINITY_DN19817_c1_g1~~TRINITY_DN19817_c1_g1_i1.p1  ORF type:complete len:750 (-),score=111.17 TRINITY_DN19817_c1_g1_i1:225-2474(-)
MVAPGNLASQLSNLPIPSRGAGRPHTPQTARPGIATHKRIRSSTIGGIEPPPRDWSSSQNKKAASPSDLEDLRAAAGNGRNYSNLSQVDRSSQDKGSDGSSSEDSDQCFADVYFDKYGVVNRKNPKNWLLKSCIGAGLAKSCHVEMGHGSLSTRQQLMNTTRSLENAKARVEVQIKQSVAQHEEYIAQVGDPERIRYLQLIFAPLKDLPEHPTFQDLLKDTVLPGDLEAEDKERRKELARRRARKATAKVCLLNKLGSSVGSPPTATDATKVKPAIRTKATGGAMSNQQRVLLLAVFQHMIFRVSGPTKSQLMKRCTWFRFLIHSGLLGCRADMDECSGPQEATIDYQYATRVFNKYAESGNVLTFSGWASATQFILKSPGFHETQHEAVGALFDRVLARAQEKYGLKTQDLIPSSSTMRGRQSMAARSTASVASMTMSVALLTGAPSEAASQCGDSVAEGAGEDDIAPLKWQIALGEEQMCEPETLQMLHQFLPHLKHLFMYYAAGSSKVNEADLTRISPEKFRRMLVDIRFFPQFVQTHSLQRHLGISQERCGEEDLDFEAFVECLVRIGYVFLITYGNIKQQAAPARLKILWLLAQLHARVPRHLLVKLSESSTLEGRLSGNSDAEYARKIAEQRQASKQSEAAADNKEKKKEPALMSQRSKELWKKVKTDIMDMPRRTFTIKYRDSLWQKMVPFELHESPLTELILHRCITASEQEKPLEASMSYQNLGGFSRKSSVAESVYSRR